jgi:hypothetical protein
MRTNIHPRTTMENANIPIEYPMSGRTHGNRRAGNNQGEAMTRKELNVLLAEQETNLSQWAKANGYQPRTVAQVVSRYLGKDRKPRGLTTYKILRDLSRMLGQEIIPGILEEETDS